MEILSTIYALLSNPIAPFVAAPILFLLGGLMYRWRGMSGDDVPVIFKSQQVRRIMCTVFVALGLFIATQSLWVFLAIPFMLYGIVLGHGSYFSGQLHIPNNPNAWVNEDNEAIAFITKLFSDPLDEKTRMIGMALTGLVSTLTVLLIPVIAWFASGTVVAIAPWFALAGILKTVVYFKIFPTDTGKSELLWGAILTGLSPLAGFDFGFWTWVLI